MTKKRQSLIFKMQKKIRLRRAVKKFKAEAHGIGEAELLVFTRTCQGMLDTAGFIPDGYPSTAAFTVRFAKALQAARMTVSAAALERDGRTVH